jgi:purine nucleosidase
MATSVILDTDIGTDVDDCLALGVIFGSPELDLVGVTCVYGDVDLRARMVQKLLRLRGLTGLPVITGARPPLLNKRAVYWAGHEGVGLLEPGDESLAATGDDAPGYIVRTVNERPGEIHLLAIGPLTNIAIALLRDPGLGSRLAGLTIMGGSVRGPQSLQLPFVEHNIRCDPEAAQVVFASGIPLSLVPLDVTQRVVIRPADVARIRAAGTPYHHAIAEQVDRYPRFADRGYTYLHDPLAAATVVRPDLVTWQEAHLSVELGGEQTSGMTLLRQPTADHPANARVALDVDVPRAEAFVTDRLTR